MIVIDKIFIDNKEYRYVEICNRGKYIAEDGSAINPIRRKQKCSIHMNEDGYPCFGGGIPVHLYVARAWVDGYFEGAEVNHLDYNRTNYHASNLEWSTHIDNIHYSFDNGRHADASGKNNPNYNNRTLRNKLMDNPELKKEYYSRPGTQNGRASHLYVYTEDMQFIKEFDLIKDCAAWLVDIFHKSKSSIPKVQSSISTAMKMDKPYRHFLFYKSPKHISCQSIAKPDEVNKSNQEGLETTTECDDTRLSHERKTP